MDSTHGRVFVNARGEAVPDDGMSPVAWRVAAYVLATRSGHVLLLAKAFSGRRRGERPIRSGGWTRRR